MERAQRLLERLDQIGESLQKTEGACALLGLGSVGKERERLDEFSDLDFFVIVAQGYKAGFIDNLAWLANVEPIAYSFQNTKDGHKVLFNDGIYCEFAVFEAEELKGINFAEGRVVWKNAYFDEGLSIPQIEPQPWKVESLNWAVGEALTCVYVGLCRFARGEKLSAARFIQNHAVDCILAASHFFYAENTGLQDKFGNERRYEKRYPTMAGYLPKMIQGYDRSPESAVEIIKVLEDHVSINQHMKKVILDLANSLIEQH